MTTIDTASGPVCARSIVARAKRKPTWTDDRLEEAALLLPQADPETKGIERWWQVGATISEPGEPNRVLANYMLDCELGAAFGDTFVRVLRRYPDQAFEFTKFTLKAMVSIGRLSGVEVAFLDRIAALVASDDRYTTPLSLIKPVA